MINRKGIFIKIASVLICLCVHIGYISANNSQLINQLEPANNSQQDPQQNQQLNQPLTQQQLADIHALYSQPASVDALHALAQQLNLQLDTRGQFIQLRHLQVLNNPLLSQGQFIFSPTQGLVWQQQQPFNTLMVLKDQQLIQQNSQGKIQHLSATASSSPIAQQLPRLLQAIMAGDIDTLSADFNLFMPVTHKAGTPWQLGLQAKAPQVQASMGNITLSGDTQLHTLVMTSSRADISDYTQIRFIDAQQGPLNDTELALFSLGSESAKE